MANISWWKDVEETTWEPISSLGQQWMVKSTASDRGYIIMLTDGCGLWGENRSAKYVVDQADEWASCIEAGIVELSNLVVSEMKKIGQPTFGEDRKDITITVQSRLNDMSYKWEFHLKRLNDELFKHHWVMPSLVQFHHLGTRVKQLTTELENKNRQLEELLPDSVNSKNASKNASKKKVALIESSAEAVLASGTWTILQDHLVEYPKIMKHLHSIRNGESKDEGHSRTQNSTVNVKIKRQTEEENEDLSEEAELLKQQERRKKIQELAQGIAPQSVPQKKKKKKLNI